jgi:maleate isomerase
MADALGHRAKWGLIVPSKNTVCETEMHRLVPPGITINTARAVRKGPAVWGTDDAMKQMARAIRDAEPDAIRAVMTCEPNYLLMGEGGFSFPRAELEAFDRKYEEISGLRVASSARAFLHALERMKVRKVAVLTPRLPDSGIVSGGLWEACGYEVAAAKGLGCTSIHDIANLTEDTLRTSLAELARSDADVILATGSEIALAHMIGEAEEWIGKPVLHLNAVLVWYALRDSGFDDRLAGYGTLLNDY